MEIAQRSGKEKVKTLYFGGGTPSVMQRGLLTEVYREIEKNFDLSELEEFTVECNPDSVTQEFIDEIKLLGANRVSIGLQSTNDCVLKRVNRPHTGDDFINAVKLIQANGIDDISSDVIIGLPDQSPEDVYNALYCISGLDIDHLSLYSLSVEEGTPLFNEGYTVDEDKQADIYETALKILRWYRYERYETSNFARKGKISKHNYTYWTGENYYGFGVSAHSLIDGTREENTDSIEEYLSGKTQKNAYVLTKDDEREEMVMLSLRTSVGLSLERYEKEFGSIFERKAKEIDKLLSLEVIEIIDGYLRVTDKGAYLLNSIITELI